VSLLLWVVRVVKRDGSLEPFDRDRIRNAVLGAMREIGRPDYEKASQVTDEVVRMLIERGKDPHVEEIQDVVEISLMRHGLFDVAKAYITYRKRREVERGEKRVILGREPLRWTKKELTVNAVRLLASRYLLRDENGRLTETPEGMVLRVASAVAASEVYSTINTPLPDDFIQNTYIMESFFRLSINSPQPIRNNYVIDAYV